MFKDSILIKLILLVLTFIVLKDSLFLFFCFISNSYSFITTFKVLYKEFIDTVDS